MISVLVESFEYLPIGSGMVSLRSIEGLFNGLLKFLSGRWRLSYSSNVSVNDQCWFGSNISSLSQPQYIRRGVSTNTCWLGVGYSVSYLLLPP